MFNGLIWRNKYSEGNWEEVGIRFEHKWASLTAKGKNPETKYNISKFNFPLLLCCDQTENPIPEPIVTKIEILQEKRRRSCSMKGRSKKGRQEGWREAKRVFEAKLNHNYQLIPSRGVWTWWRWNGEGCRWNEILRGRLVEERGKVGDEEGKNEETRLRSWRRGKKALQSQPLWLEQRNLCVQYPTTAPAQAIPACTLKKYINSGLL